MKIEHCFTAPGVQPNGLQWYRGALWIIDQTEPPSRLFQVRITDGTVLHECPTTADRAGGLTFYKNMTPDGFRAGLGYPRAWIASSFANEIIEVHPTGGETVHVFPRPYRAHGLEWRDDRLWAAIPRGETGAIIQLDPETAEEVAHIPFPGGRPHGLAWRDGLLWCPETTQRTLYGLDPETGEVQRAIELPGDEDPHGMTVVDGVFWFCDANRCLIWRLVEDG